MAMGVQRPDEAAVRVRPTPELLLMRVFVTAHVATAHMKPRERARSFLRVSGELLAAEDSAAQVFPIRPGSQQSDCARVQREAVAMWRQYLPVFIAAIPHAGED